METGTTLITDVSVAEKMLAKLANSPIENVQPVSNAQFRHTFQGQFVSQSNLGQVVHPPILPWLSHFKGNIA